MSGFSTHLGDRGRSGSVRESGISLLSHSPCRYAPSSSLHLIHHSGLQHNLNRQDPFAVPHDGSESELVFAAADLGTLLLVPAVYKMQCLSAFNSAANCCPSSQDYHDLILSKW